MTKDIKEVNDGIGEMDFIEENWDKDRTECHRKILQFGERRKQEGIEEGLKMAMECLPDIMVRFDGEKEYQINRRGSHNDCRNEVEESIQQKLSQITIKKEDK